jgi:hypothetical protein
MAASLRNDDDVAPFDEPARKPVENRHGYGLTRGFVSTVVDDDQCALLR